LGRWQNIVSKHLSCNLEVLNRLLKMVSPITLSLVFHETEMLHAQTGPRHSDAHTQGIAQLTILQERANLLIEFETSAANIVGFEHAPRNDT